MKKAFIKQHYLSDTSLPLAMFLDQTKVQLASGTCFIYRYEDEFFLITNWHNVTGLNPANKPKISVFDNSYQYDKMLVEANISFNSTCEHHFLPIVGKAHIGYVSSGKVIGLSKLNRIVDYYAKRPQVQERMIMQIFNELKTVLETDNVIVVMEATHLCVSSRGIKDESSFTSTLQYGGVFNQKEFRDDFYKMIHKE